jgi:serine/threonine protein kinase
VLYVSLMILCIFSLSHITSHDSSSSHSLFLFSLLLKVDLPDSSHNPHDPPASFASSVSSIAKNNISACDNEVHTESTAALTPTRGIGGGSIMALLDHPDTPREVEVHFQMPNCSPIPPGIPEAGNESSISSSRPLPDSHAFGDDDDDDDDTTTLHNSSTESQVPALPHLRPPPTPIRIPTWSSPAFGRPQQKKLTRSNSLLATKVLASDVATNDLFPEVMTLSGSFRIIGSPLGKGVFADVCKVQSKTDERYYALKCQRQAFRGRKDRDLALAEVRCMLILQKEPPLSPYLLRFFKAWQEDERIHVVTELCCKDTCRQLLDKHPVFLPEGVIWKLVFDVTSGLAHMHARKLVHNDIKPSNILLERNEGLGAICKIGDFGMTRPVDSTDDGQEGDQKYMALELLQKSKLQPSADIFSLGLTLYEAASASLTVPSHGPLWRQLRNGQHPFDFATTSGSSNGTGGDHHRSVELQDLIRHMMHPDAQQRPSAVSILDVGKAQDAGTSYNRFLADYIGTVEDQELALDENDDDDDDDDEYQTPRNVRTLCSPPPPPGQCNTTGIAAPSSFLFSSPQA